MNDLTSGSNLGRYELLVRLGRGGMASVWVAREHSASLPGEERLVAVKVMLPELSRHSDFRAMFLEEGQIVRSIDHPNVVKVHEVGEQDGLLFMAMDWIEGDSLLAVIREARKRRPVPAELAVKIIADAAAGLHAAHELRGWDGELRNLVHCDVSPHNILVGLDGRAKIVDFGVANATLHSDAANEERVKGKFSYMSPEQATAQRLDRRSDIFSLGIVLFELTTGERLFRGDTPEHSLQLVRSGEIPDPRSVHPGYPDRLAQITLCALDRDPARRFQTSAEFAVALERYLVAERVLVSHASVAKLVRRVIGPNIEALRQNLREALVARDGRLHAELIPDLPAMGGTFTDVSINLPHSPALFSLSRTPQPQTLEQPAPVVPPPKPRRRVGALLFGVLGVSAATVGGLWAMHRPGPSPLRGASGKLDEGGSPSLVKQQDSSVAHSESAEARASGVDVNSLPLTAPSAGVGVRPPSVGRVSAGVERAAAGERAAGDRAAAEREHLAAEKDRAPAASASAKSPHYEEAVHLDEEVAPAPRASTAPKLPEPSVTPAVAPASGPTGPFNRGAALAQLNAAAARASACGQGASGSGRATVTFAPDGTASRVSVSPPFAGTASEGCVDAAFRGARVPAFTGSSVSLPWSFRVR
ncbi:MAG TPA: serine/threonine-protein kinase [Polyangiaceae bacterium]|nr:serine/threonine-protein kinase [Polyangiaceae bacterium]